MVSKITNCVYCDVCGAEITFDIAASTKGLVVVMENLKEIQIEISPDLDLCEDCIREALDRAKDSY